MSAQREVVRFDTLPGLYWNDRTRIELLQRHILVHSILYYEMDTSCISDATYDKLSKQLVQLQQEVGSEILKQTQYYYVLYDFEGSTGFDLASRLRSGDRLYLQQLAQHILATYKRDVNRGGTKI